VRAAYNLGDEALTIFWWSKAARATWKRSERCVVEGEREPFREQPNPKGKW
jgi:hypothetical protein